MAEALTVDKAIAKVDGWGVDQNFGLHDICRALREEVARLRGEVVFGVVTEGEQTIYVQGYEPTRGDPACVRVTADNLTAMGILIRHHDEVIAERLEARITELQEANTKLVEERRVAIYDYNEGAKGVRAMRSVLADIARQLTAMC